MRPVKRQPDRSRRMKIAFRIGLATGIVVVACAVLLIADHVIVLSRTPAQERRIEALEEQVKIDAEIATRLHEERERWTEGTQAVVRPPNVVNRSRPPRGARARASLPHRWWKSQDEGNFAESASTRTACRTTLFRLALSFFASSGVREQALR